MDGLIDEAWGYEMLQELFFFFTTPSLGGCMAMAYWNECTTERCRSSRHYNY
jgi:hypothetical protein